MLLASHTWHDKERMQEKGQIPLCKIKAFPSHARVKLLVWFGTRATTPRCCRLIGNLANTWRVLTCTVVSVISGFTSISAWDEKLAHCAGHPLLVTTLPSPPEPCPGSCGISSFMSGRTTSDRRARGCNLYCGGGCSISKSVFISILTSRVDSLGVGGRRALYNPIQKGSGSKPTCIRLKVSSCISALVMVLSEPPSLFQAACVSSIRTRRVVSSVCVAASSLTRTNLRTRPRVMVKSTSIRRTSHSGIAICYFQTRVLKRKTEDSKSRVHLWSCRCGLPPQCPGLASLLGGGTGADICALPGVSSTGGT